MQHVFISYVRENRKEISELCQVLASYGIDFWLDLQDIKGGEFWELKIQDAIQTSDFFIACFSKEYDERRETYMNKELTLAIDRLRGFHVNNVWFIPVKLNECEIPNFEITGSKTLQSLHHVELYKDWDAGVQSILESISKEIQHESAEIAEIEAKLYHSIIRERLKVIDILQSYARGNVPEWIISAHLCENLWLLDPSWDKATETPLVEERIVAEFAELDANLTQSDRTARFDIKYKKTSGTHIIIELKHAHTVFDDYELLAQADKFKAILEKLIQATGKYESVEFVCIVGKPLRQWTTPVRQMESKNMLATKNTRVVLYSELIENSYRIYKDFLDVSEKVKRTYVHE